MMSQEEFYYLYVNVNCLAELGLREFEKTTDDGFVDFDQYMNKAYSHQDAIKRQAERAFQKADLKELDHSLELIPQPLPSIQQRMNEEEMQQWENSFAKCEDQVMSLVAEVRLLSVA